MIQSRHERGRWASIVVVAEGATPTEGTLALVSGEVDAFGTCAWAASATCWPRPSRSAPATRPGPSCWATSSGRHAHGLRPGAGHPLRDRRHRRGARQRLGDDGGAAGGRHRAGPAGRGHRRAQAHRPRGVRGGVGVLRPRAAQPAPWPLMDPEAVPPSAGTATRSRPGCRRPLVLAGHHRLTSMPRPRGLGRTPK